MRSGRPWDLDQHGRESLRWYPQQDSNLRTRLRRPALYPLSYGGRIGNEAEQVRPVLGHLRLRLLVLVADGEHQPILDVI